MQIFKDFLFMFSILDATLSLCLQSRPVCLNVVNSFVCLFI